MIAAVLRGYFCLSFGKVFFIVMLAGFFVDITGLGYATVILFISRPVIAKSLSDYPVSQERRITK